MFWLFLSALIVCVAIGSYLLVGEHLVATSVCIVLSGVLAGFAAISLLPILGLLFALCVSGMTMLLGFVSLSFE